MCLDGYFTLTARIHLRREKYTLRGSFAARQALAIEDQSVFWNSRQVTSIQFVARLWFATE